MLPITSRWRQCPQQLAQQQHMGPCSCAGSALARQLTTVMPRSTAGLYSEEYDNLILATHSPLLPGVYAAPCNQHYM